VGIIEREKIILIKKGFRKFKKLLKLILKSSVKSAQKPNIQVGKHTYGFENIKTSWGGGAEVFIGSFTSIALNLEIQLGGNHNSQWVSTYPFGHVSKDYKVLFGPPVKHHPAPAKSVMIGSDVWIGNGVSIMGGVRIGDGAVIAMNSHVVGDVGAYEVFGGNPARKIRDRFPTEIVAELRALKWWEAEDGEIELIKHLLTQPPTLYSIEEMKKILEQAKNSVTVIN
jgi:acetyltransferase-like isoleucine patch superfamily enzyme